MAYFPTRWLVDLHSLRCHLKTQIITHFFFRAAAESQRQWNPCIWFKSTLSSPHACLNICLHLWQSFCLSGIIITCHPTTTTASAPITSSLAVLCSILIRDFTAKKKNQFWKCVAFLCHNPFVCQLPTGPLPILLHAFSVDCNPTWLWQICCSLLIIRLVTKCWCAAFECGYCKMHLWVLWSTLTHSPFHMANWE